MSPYRARAAAGCAMILGLQVLAVRHWPFMAGEARQHDRDDAGRDRPIRLVQQSAYLGTA